MGHLATSADTRAELLGSSSVPAGARLTVAVPHYKHRAHLELVLESLLCQTSEDFEILISDDCSPDDSNHVIPGLLERSGRAFSYYAQRSNLGYDGNVRFCLQASRGRHVMLLGNDDALADCRVVEDLLEGLKTLGLPEVAVVNYSEWGSETPPTERVFATEIIGSGPSAALANFRMFSFVSGLIYDREAAVRHETAKWDQSIYYQIYIASRILAAGGRLGGINRVAIAKDVKIAGKSVANYVTRHANQPWSFERRDGGMPSAIRVTVDAVLPYIAEDKRSSAAAAVIQQVLTTTYLFWLVEYRRVANWAFAVGIARALHPGRLLGEYSIAPRDRLRLSVTYFFVTLIGLFAPVKALRLFKDKAAKFLRIRQQRANGG
jgi:glycosyltransferase involved in cell wall biosynthesis